MNYQELIIEILDGIDPVLKQICAPMLETDDHQLAYWPAAVSKHHGYYGGLMKHTYEVLRFALDMVANIPKADKTIIAVAAVWHDYGKLWDYNVGYVDSVRKEIGDVSYTDTAGKVGHLSISYMCFSRFYGDNIVGKVLRFSDGRLSTGSWVKEVQHTILAHHGRKEWGSPREPQTIEALAVHQADMLSVMVDTGDNPQLRNGSDKKPKPELYKAEDLSPGDVVTFRKLNDKSAEKRHGTFIRLDVNNCPIVRVSGVLTKVPLRTIQSIIPPPDEPTEKPADKIAERTDTGMEPAVESPADMGHDAGGTSQPPG